MRLYIGNLATQIQEQELQKAFAAFGQVQSVSIMRAKATGESLGYGFVIMPQREEARAALEAMNGQPLKGQNLRVEKSKQRLARRNKPSYQKR